jgi:hypothetical protein
MSSRTVPEALLAAPDQHLALGDSGIIDARLEPQGSCDGLIQVGLTEVIGFDRDGDFFALVCLNDG